jgi:hypothetical protein
VPGALLPRADKSISGIPTNRQGESADPSAFIGTNPLALNLSPWVGEIATDAILLKAGLLNARSEYHEDHDRTW